MSEAATAASEPLARARSILDEFLGSLETRFSVRAASWARSRELWLLCDDPVLASELEGSGYVLDRFHGLTRARRGPAPPAAKR